MMFLIQIRYIQYSDQLIALRKGIREIFVCKIWNPLLWNPESRVPLTIRNQNPSSSDKVRNQVPGIRNPRYGIQNQDCLGFPLRNFLTWGYLYYKSLMRVWTAGSFVRTPVTAYFIIFKVICNVLVDIVRFYFCRDNIDILTWWQLF